MWHQPPEINQSNPGRASDFVTYTTRSQVAHHPLGIAVALLLVGEHRLVGVAEGEVEGLSWEVSNDVGRVSSP